MALEYYKITNLSSGGKTFVYNSGSSEPGTEFEIFIQGYNSEEIVQSFYPPIKISEGISEQTFNSDSFFPTQPGYAWLWNDGNKVKYIKITHTTANGANISNYISDTSVISFAMVGARNAQHQFMYTPTGSRNVEDYYLNNSTKKGNYSSLVVNQNPSSFATSDLTSGQRNFNFESSGDYTWYATSSGNIDEPIPTTGYSSSIAQGYFPKNIDDFGRTQFIRGWANANYYVEGSIIPGGGSLVDYLNNFNTGSTERDYDSRFPYTSSVLPWFINATESITPTIASSSFGVYNGQNRTIKIGPSFRNTSDETPYGEALYGDPAFEYGGSGANDFISYYYKEDTNEILVYDPNSIENEPKNPSPLFYPAATYNNILVGVGDPKTYVTTEGHEIVVGNGNQLSVFRGQQTLGAGDTNAFNYNRYLHRPYKIYLLAVTGSNDNPSKITEAYVSFSSSLAINRPKDGRYTFETFSEDDLSLTASINLTASNALPLPPSNYGTADYGEDSYGGDGVTPANQTWQTASLVLYLAEPNQNIGTVLTSSTLYIDDINNDNSILLKTVISSSYVYPGRSLRLAVNVDTGSLSFPDLVNSSLIVNDYTMSIGGPVPEISDLVPTFIDNVLQIPEDCNPFVGTATVGAPSSVVMDVDYSTDSSTPVNLDLILKQEAIKAEIPDSFYSSFATAGIRYAGSRMTSFTEQYNVYNEGDLGTYGKLPTIDINKAYSAYFNRVYDPYPVLNEKTSFEVKYIIDENGNAANPRIGDYSFFNLEGSLSEKEKSTIAVTDKETEILYNLNGSSEIFKTGRKPVPILYSQVAAKAYTSSIFVTGKEPLTDDPVEFKDYSFNAFQNVGSPQVVSFSTAQLSPDNIITGSGENVTSSYDESSGTTTLPTNDISGSQGAGNGRPLSDEYTYRVNYTFETSNITKTKTKNGSFFKKSEDTPDAGNFYMAIEKNGQNSKMAIESLYADVVHRNPNTDSGIELKSFNVQTTSMNNRVALQTDKSLRINFNSDNFLASLNSTGTGGTDIRRGGGLIKVRWRVKLRLNDPSPIKQGDIIKTKVNGAMRGDTNGPGAREQSHFFYNNNGEYPGFADIALILEGTKSLPSPALDANYFQYSGSSTNAIQMISENGNIAYGRPGFKQQYMSYGTSGSYVPEASPTDPPFNGSFNVPSGSADNQGWKDTYINNPAFSTGKEPEFLGFQPTRYDWSVESGDEIRFNNDESLVYKVIEIFPPISQPIIGDEKIGRLKLILDREISPNANLNFFLIRRYVVDKGNVIIDIPKPYGQPVAPNTATGLMFPQFTVKELSTTPDEVLKNLLEQKLIE